MNAYNAFGIYSSNGDTSYGHKAANPTMKALCLGK